jgi:hypothetical protein
MSSMSKVAISHRHVERIRVSSRKSIRAFKGASESILITVKVPVAARAGYYQGLRRSERAAFVDEPDASVHC